MKELEELRQIFVAEVDDELREENERQIQEWEQSLILNQALLSWKEHDVTREMAKQAKESYRALGLLLANNRELTEKQRLSLWARQDAMAWLLSLSEQDPQTELKRIHAEIKTALNAV